jgi:hypothetical protein
MQVLDFKHLLCCRTQIVPSIHGCNGADRYIYTYIYITLDLVQRFTGKLPYLAFPYLGRTRQEL